MILLLAVEHYMCAIALGKRRDKTHADVCSKDFQLPLGELQEGYCAIEHWEEESRWT